MGSNESVAKSCSKPMEQTFDSEKGIGESLAPLRSLRKMLSSPKGYTIWFSYEEIFVIFRFIKCCLILSVMGLLNLYFQY